MTNKRVSKQLIIFFVLAFAMSWLLWLSPVLHSNGEIMPNFLLLLGQFALLGPALAAVIVLACSEGKSGIKALFKNAWNWKFNKLWLVAVVGLPFIIVIISFVLKSAIENKPLYIGNVGMPVLLFVVILFFAGGPLEEFGWRGYALPKLLKKYPLVPASLILGLLHGLWHIPLHFIEGTVQSNIPVWEFTAVTAVGAFIYSWLYIRTNGSLSAMIIHHWSANLASALFVYWDTALGRYLFFGVQLLFAGVIAIVYKVRTQRREQASL